MANDVEVHQLTCPNQSAMKPGRFLLLGTLPGSNPMASEKKSERCLLRNRKSARPLATLRCAKRPAPGHRYP